MKYEPQDVQTQETCKSNHKYQFVEVDEDGKKWQICAECKLALKV
jgi:hypothetical protein